MNRRDAIAGLLCSAAAVAQANAEERPLVFAMIRPETQFLGRWQRLIYREAFARVGRDIAFVDYPAARASVELDRGSIDGEGGRPLSYADSSKNILRLRVPLFEVTYVAVGRRGELPPISSWDSLKDFKGVVAYKAGVYTTSTQLPRVLPVNRLIGLPETDRGLKMVALGRSDLYIDEELTILSALVDAELATLPLARAGVLGTVDVYGYLHQRHAALAVRLGDVLAQMQKQGDIERLRRQVEKEFLVSTDRWRP
ncbi:hypothetical protein SNE35_17285 [Paucibacter sp. R3-3]|uniref:Solute-binding protein family 3/N-terminal domain-containing protein n=1 Tax=Roseateles agri TaxID=3098619 RepID=A0ABU5DIZ6_9BURK|nr:hypothetical protein [Paucibacter sp. R3-3]MDY0746270.1 hypothetical protein [Paucibacter sp. R3-3]